MAKQIGEIMIVGTVADITFYRMEGKYYARRKTSLTGKRVKRDLRFTRTMESAHRLAKGSQLASKVYRSLPKHEQVYALFKELKSMAMLALKEERSEAEVLRLLQQRVGKLAKTQDLQADCVLAKVRSIASGTKKSSRLFWVYGGTLKEVKKQRTGGRRLAKKWSTLQLGDPQRE
jgi:hypothetical protein